jgi:hypothetical protein
VFDGDAEVWPSEVAATISVGTAAAQARTINRLKRIVPLPLVGRSGKGTSSLAARIHVSACQAKVRNGPRAVKVLRLSLRARPCDTFPVGNKKRQGTSRPDLEEIRRLARELASRRDSVYAEMQGEVELMKATLRERAAAIAQREHRLAELEHQMGANGLAEELAAARRAAADAEAERRLAIAERERLDEREQRIRAVEKELAALRIELEQQRAAPPRPPSASARQKELDTREAKLDAREAALRGDTMSMASPLGFADGLAALAHPDAG